MREKRILFLMFLFFICGIKTIHSQITGIHNYEMDTINLIIRNFCNSPVFDNYPNNSIIFPEIIRCNEKIYRIQDINSLDMKNMEDNYLQRKLPDSLFNILLELDIINRCTWQPINPVWQSYEPNDTIASNRRVTVFIPNSCDNLPEVSDFVNDRGNTKHLYKNREDYLKKMRAGSRMYSLGNISINENFVSKLIYVFMKDKILSIQGLYLVNIKNNQLRSVTTILSNLCINCNNFTYLQSDIRLLDNQVFSLKYTPVYKENMDGYYKDIYYCPHFYYDDEGYLHIIPYTYDFPHP